MRETEYRSSGLTKFGAALDTMEFGRRVTVERELDGLYQTAVRNSLSMNNPNLNKNSPVEVIQPAVLWEGLPLPTIVFDQSGNFVVYSTMLGVKIVNLITNRMVRSLGKFESNHRFLTIALYQGKIRGTVSADNLKQNAEDDPTLIATSYKKNRFFLFTRREPEQNETDDGNIIERDIFNEKPTKEELAMAMTKMVNKRLGKSAVIHTTKGDIFIRLFHEECPKTVENFTMHSKNGYYNSCIFHRVIKGFMIQTGDPLGDGSGGSSIWGNDFEDEFIPTLRHNKPFMVSMANCGPSTNGSQFFITSVPCPSLDNKHTIFGTVYKGKEIVLDIERVRTDKSDKPLEDIKIMSITIGHTEVTTEDQQ